MNASRCGCPSGNFFCSHLLGFLLILRLIHKLKTLSFEMLVQYFLDSIKTLQNIPLAVSFVYRDILTEEKKLKEAQKQLGEDLASQLPGYSAEDEVDDFMTEVELERAARHQKDAPGETCIDVCFKIDEYFEKAFLRSRKHNRKRKYDIDSINAYNRQLVDREFSQEEKATQATRLLRIFECIEEGLISGESGLASYVLFPSNRKMLRLAVANEE